VEKFTKDIQTLLGLRLSPRQLAAFERYEQDLLSWNEKFNLTAIRDLEGIRTKHFLDSLSCLLVMRENPPLRLIDIGTGAGFPGIPLKIALPNLAQLTLVESVGKKADFCRHIVDELALDHVDVQTGRAEELGQASSCCPWCALAGRSWPKKASRGQLKRTPLRGPFSSWEAGCAPCKS